MSLYGHNPFYFGLLRKYVVYFGRIFSDIRITRADPDTGDETALIRVPISYSARDRNLLRMKIQPDSPEAAKCPPGFLVFPHIGFELTGISYAPDRNKGIHNMIVEKDTDNFNKAKRQWEAAPYDLNFRLYIMSKNIEDANKIVEQILPWFRPHFPSTLNLIPEMNITRDVPINLDSVSFEDTYQGDLQDGRRNVFWTFDFTMYGYMFGPIVSKPLIKVSNTDFYIGNTSSTNTTVMSVQVTPGQDANGVATSNSNNTVAYANIAIDSDFGYIENWTYDATDDDT